ncbi:MAG: hypothetical protein EB127_07835 [Alphaproteobacteria bacterium]|nr:hypothetical protein [Alphaproteobacteria bacterium]
MSRTRRNLEGMHRGALRFPQTTKEIRQLDAIVNDPELKDYPVSGLNHMKSREHNLPTAWDDRVVSGYEQMDYK